MTSDVNPPADKPKRKPRLNLRSMQSAAQGRGWLWIEKDAATKVRMRCFRVKDFRNHILRYLEVDGVWMHEGEAENG